MLKIFEAGNAVDVFTPKQAPQQNHQTAVGDRQIGSEHGAPIRLVLAQSSETSSRRSDKKPSMLRHQGNRLFNITVEELNAKNLASRNHKMNIEAATSNVGRQISNIYLCSRDCRAFL